LLKHEVRGKWNALQMAHPLEPPQECFSRHALRTAHQRVLPRVVEANYFSCFELPWRPARVLMVRELRSSLGSLPESFVKDYPNCEIVQIHPFDIFYILIFKNRWLVGFRFLGLGH